MIDRLSRLIDIEFAKEVLEIVRDDSEYHDSAKLIQIKSAAKLVTDLKNHLWENY